ncbi:hypothetical protein OS187_11935 [Xanthomonadaceae bacterium JHOS43]|nr:hypothetical protein [Xanthomonadaceae bacterium JHOS43]MCX7561991.1 hypothetical protein [Xanthomonadaceae bacterium XH05]
MSSRAALRLAPLLFLAAPAYAAGEEDEAWIARYMSSSSAPGLARGSAQARTVEFAQLSGHIGRRARFVLSDGRERRGLIEGVRGSEVQVRAQFGGGFFLYTLARADLRAIQLD